MTTRGNKFSAAQSSVVEKPVLEKCAVRETMTMIRINLAIANHDNYDEDNDDDND